MAPDLNKPRNPESTPIQRKTTLKWGSDGELSAVDMARILDKLGKAELTTCHLTCELEDSI